MKKVKGVLFIGLFLLISMVFMTIRVNALNVDIVSVTDIVSDENNYLKSFKIRFRTPGTIGTATSKLAIQTTNLGIGGTTILSDTGSYNTTHGYTSFVDNPADCGFVMWAGDSFQIYSNGIYTIDVTVPDATIDLDNEAIYYVYIWTLYNSKVYPDYQLFTLNSGSGTLSLGDSIDTYDVTYNANGGTVNPTSATYTGDALVLPLPTKDNYIFNGWYTAPTNGTKIGNNGESYTPTSNVTIYAQWINTFNINYYYNSTLLNDLLPTYTTYTYKTGMPLLPQYNLLGYSFRGWYNAIDLLTKVDSITTEDYGDKNLYAEMEANEYTITFDSNDGSLVTPITQDYRTTVNAPINPTKTGYTFDAWYSDEELQNEYTFTTMPSEDITLYAGWNINEYTITFDSNGGSLVTPITQDYGTTVNAPINPTKIGHTFDAWYSDEELQNEYTFGTMPADNITLYAGWNVNEYTITFDSNGGSLVTPITQNYGTTVNAPTDPTRTGYAFYKWYSDEQRTNAYTFATMPSEDITLYAGWSLGRYTLTYEYNGGTGGPASKNIIYTQPYGTLPTPTTTGYTFDGWYSDAEYGTKVTENTIAGTEDTTIYAKWTPYTYTINFNDNVDNEVIAVPSNQTKTFGTRLVIVGNRPERTGYTFAGWAQSPDGKGTIFDVIERDLTTVNGNTTRLYAKWVINEYTITFDSNGGSSVTPITQYYATTVNAPSNPTKTGHSFDKWYSDEELQNEYTFGAMPSESITLYAGWNINKYTITTSVNGGNGTITEGTQTLNHGLNYVITFTPATGYMIDGVKIDGNSIEVTSNTYTLTNVISNRNVEVTYKKIPFTLVVNEVTNATITPNGVITVLYGDNKDITITANIGFKLKSVKVNNVEKLTTLSNNILSLTDIQADTTIIVEVEKIVYEVLEGKDQTHTIGTDNNTVIKIDADKNLFSKLFINEVELGTDKYEITSGSTIITLKKSYLDSLDKGTYDLKAVFTDGGESTTSFTIAKLADNPKTGDSIITSIILGSISLIGLLGTGIYLKKKRYN